MSTCPATASAVRTCNFVLWCACVVIIGYPVAWVFGTILGLAFMFGLLFGHIRVYGYSRLVGAAIRGKVIIMVNHPNLVEPFVIPALLFPWYWIFPWCFPWSTPDQKLLGEWKMPAWQRIALRCIIFDRTKIMTSGRAWKKIQTVMRYLRAIVVFFPEEGRTNGAGNKGRIPLSYGNRMLQELRSSALRHAHETGAWVLPIYLYTENKAETTAFWINFRKARAAGMVFVVGHRYKPGIPFVLAEQNQILGQKILHAGEPSA